jgi:fatty acyl-CoA reductase
MENSSKVANFYKDQTILLTGATGFLGKATVEKLLRACDPKKIFILIRSKKGVDPEKRKESLFDQWVSTLCKCNLSFFPSEPKLIWS